MSEYVRVRSIKKEVMFEEVPFCLRGGEEAEKCPMLTKAETTAKTARPSSAASRLIVRTQANDGGKFPNEKRDGDDGIFCGRDALYL